MNTEVTEMNRHEVTTMLSKVFSLTNQKGGVGKTSSALNLGAALNISGKKALLIDNDPKCRIRHLGSYAEKKEMPRN
mgnify:CR=1 FL=1